MKCENCGIELETGQKFCGHCGAEIEAVKFCPNCGSKLSGKENFCAECGHSIMQDKKDEMEIGQDRQNISEIGQETATPKSNLGSGIVPEKQPQPQTRTLDEFKKELEELQNRDSKSKAAILVNGTGVIYKHFYPCLNNDETVLAVDVIQSKGLFARARKEFVALTNKRVIKFEKLRYFKPQIESMYYEEIKEMKTDRPSNAVSGTFIGEKVSIVSWDGRQINMRMVGKGEAEELKKSILMEKKHHGDTLPKSSASESMTSSSRNKKGKKKLIIGAIAIFAMIAVVISWINGPTELSDYIPLAKADVMSFIEKEQLEEILADSMYSSDDIFISLNERGNISEMVISSPEYLLYGMKVGSEFTLERDGKRLTEHNYGFSEESGDRIVYGVMSGRDTPGGDRVIGISLDENGVITELAFMKEGAQDIIEGNQEGQSYTDVLPTTPDVSWSLSDEQELENGTQQSEEYLGNAKADGFYEYDLKDDYILPLSDGRYYTVEELSAFTHQDLRIARNEIYARRGRKFETEDLKQYFSGKAWYNGYLTQEEFDDSVLNDYEMGNLELIKLMESDYSLGNPNMIGIKDVVNSQWTNQVEYGRDYDYVMTLFEYQAGIYMSISDNDVVYLGKAVSCGATELADLYIEFQPLAESDIMDKITVSWRGWDSADFPEIYGVDTSLFDGTYQFYGPYSF